MGMISGVSPQNTEALTGEVMVSPNDTSNVTSPGSKRPMMRGRQPARSRLALVRVASTISQRATAANDKRMITKSARAISLSARFVPGVADDHRKTAASMARVGSAGLGAAALFSPRSCTQRPNPGLPAVHRLARAPSIYRRSDGVKVVCAGDGPLHPNPRGYEVHSVGALAQSRAYRGKLVPRLPTATQTGMGST